MPPSSSPAPARAPGGVADRIWQFNQGRRSDTLALKYRKVRKNAFSFFRGTCHLFYQDWSAPAVLDQAPLTWVSGDLHLENFGAYLGENGLVYFDVNDFDEAALAPLTWDLVRFLASLSVGLGTLGRPAAEAEALAQEFLEVYTSALAAGGARSEDAAAVEGPIGEIMRLFPSRLAPAYLDERTQLTPSGRKLKLDQDRVLPIADAERLQVIELLEEFGRQRSAAPPVRVLDVAQLVAGTSSLGLARYLILIDVNGALDGHQLLELKEASRSSLGPYLKWSQPNWPAEAARVVGVQKLFQEVPPALLAATGLAAKSYIIRDFSRSHDRVNLADPGWTARRLAPTIRTMGRLAASGHLRGSAGPAAAGPSGAAQPDGLRAFASETAWRPHLIHYAQHCAAQSEADYREYCVAYDRGEMS